MLTPQSISQDMGMDEQEEKINRAMSDVALGLRLSGFTTSRTLCTKSIERWECIPPSRFKPGSAAGTRVFFQVEELADLRN